MDGEDDKKFEWPATRELSFIDGPSGFSLDVWVRRVTAVLGRGSFWFGGWPVVLRHGPYRFVAHRWYAAVYLRVGWRWELIFSGSSGGLSCSDWVGDVPDSVKTAVVDEVWRLVGDAERADRAWRAKRWNALASAVEKKS